MNGGILTRGGKIVTRGGKIVTVAEGQASGCECCGEEYDCELCGNCCFSTLSLASAEWAVTSISFSSGDAAAAWQTHSQSGIVYVGTHASHAGHKIWNNNSGTPSANELFVRYSCTLNGYSVLSGFNSTFGDHYEAQIYKTSGFEVMNGDCCGYDSTAYMDIRHFNGSTLLGQVQGTGTATIDITNNECCKSGAVCVEEAGDCDGSCPEEGM